MDDRPRFCALCGTRLGKYDLAVHPECSSARAAMVSAVAADEQRDRERDVIAQVVADIAGMPDDPLAALEQFVGVDLPTMLTSQPARGYAGQWREEWVIIVCWAAMIANLETGATGRGVLRQLQNVGLLAAPLAVRPTCTFTPPRYDEIYFAGVDALDES